MWQLFDRWITERGSAAALRDVNTGLRDQITALVRGEAAQKEKTKEAEAKCLALEAKVKDLEAQNAAAQKLVADLKAENGALQAERDQLRAELERRAPFALTKQPPQPITPRRT